MEIFAFCVITLEPIKILTCLVFTPQNDRLILSFGKNIMEMVRKMTRNGCKTAIYQSTFFGTPSRMVAAFTEQTRRLEANCDIKTQK